MKEQLKYLIELQKFDSRIQELRQCAAALPEKLAPDKEALAQLEAMLQAKKSELAQTETWRKDQEFVLAQEEEAIKKAKIKLQSSSSTKEFAAANRELESKRRSMSEREEQVLKVIDALEASRATIAEHEGDVAKLRERIEAEDKAALAEVAKLEQEIESELGGRSGLIEQIEDDLLKRYEHVAKRRGFALAEVVDGACRGCHMQVPPQIINLLAGGTSIETCQSCHRLLYTQAMLDDTPHTPDMPDMPSEG